MSLKIDPTATKAPKSRKVNFIIYALLGFAILSGSWLFNLWSYAHHPAIPADGKEIIVSIPVGSDFSTIQSLLLENGIDLHRFKFQLLARLLGTSRRLKAGEYRFIPAQTPLGILQQMVQGETLLWPLTIPEGSTIRQIATSLELAGWGPADHFLALTKDADFIRGLGLEVKTLEGYLFPDTYHLQRGQDEASILRMMVSRLQKILSELYGLEGDPDTPFGQFPDVERLGVRLKPHQVLTLASIVEKETGQPEERILVSAVFLNRLRENIRLQADPTVIYGIADFSGNLTRKDLLTTTPYNTYRNRGLPPGPIGNPGRATLEAIILPPERLQAKFPKLDWQSMPKFLYFVSCNNGKHLFSKNLTEHNRAVARYQPKKRPSR